VYQADGGTPFVAWLRWNRRYRIAQKFDEAPTKSAEKGA
jgi:hypothetical protein